MKCPKTAIKATFLYLDRMDKEGKLLIKNESDIKKIVTSIESDLDKFIADVKRFEENKSSLPYPKMPQFHIVSKHTISGTNYIAKGGIKRATDENNYISATTDKEAIINLNSYVDDNLTPSNEAIQSIKLENEEEFAYIGQASLIASERKIEHYILSYLMDYHSENSLSETEIDESINIINSLALKFSPNNHMFSSGINPQDYKLHLTDEIVDQIKEAILSSDKLSSVYKKEYIDVDNMLTTVKDSFNNEYKSFLLSLIPQRSVSHGDFFYGINYRYGVDENQNFLKNNRYAESTDLEVTFIPQSPTIEVNFQKSIKKEKTLFVSTINTQKEQFTKDLNAREQIPIIAEKMIFHLADPKPTLKVKFSDEVDDIKITSEQGNKNNFYHSNLTDGRIKIQVVDESDQQAGGNRGAVLRAMAKNVDNVIIGTGTGITGTAKSIVNQLANSGNIDNIKEMKRQYTELCGVFEIRSQFTKILLDLATKDSAVSLEFYDTAFKIADLQENNNEKNIATLVENFAKYIINKAREHDLQIDSLDVPSSISVTKQIFDTVSKDKSIKTLNLKTGVALLKHIIFNNAKLIKEVAGVQAGMLASLVMSQKDSDISITTRELLTNKKENIQILDKSSKIRKKEQLKNENEAEYLEKNIMSPKCMREYLLKQAEERFTSHVSYLMKSNFEFFVKAFKENNGIGRANLKILSNMTELTPKEFIYHSSASGSSTKDDVFSLYKNYLLNNGKLSDELIKKIDKEKMEVFNTCLNAFEDSFLNTHLLGREIADSSLNGYTMNMNIPKKLFNLYGESEEIDKLLYFENSYPYSKETRRPYVFSVNTHFMKKEWKKFINEGVDHLFSLVNNQSVELIDNFSSRGKEKLIKESINLKENPVIVSKRVSTSIFNLYDTVSLLTKRDNIKKPFFLLAVENAELKKAVSKIDSTILAKNNIHVKVLDSKQVAVEVNKANSKGEQYCIISNYKPISRGLSLAETHRTILTDGIDEKSDGIQLMARAINPSADRLSSNLYFYNGGTDVELRVKYSDYSKVKGFLAETSPLLVFDNGKLIIDDENMDLENFASSVHKDKNLASLTETYSSLINERLDESNQVYKGFTSGKLADTAQSNLNDLITITEPYKEILERAREEGEIDIAPFEQVAEVV